MPGWGVGREPELSVSEGNTAAQAAALRGTLPGVGRQSVCRSPAGGDSSGTRLPPAAPGEEAAFQKGGAGRPFPLRA